MLCVCVCVAHSLYLVVVVVVAGTDKDITRKKKMGGKRGFGVQVARLFIYIHI